MKKGVEDTIIFNLSIPEKLLKRIDDYKFEQRFKTRADGADVGAWKTGRKLRCRRAVCSEKKLRKGPAEAGERR